MRLSGTEWATEDICRRRVNGENLLSSALEALSALAGEVQIGAHYF